MFYQMLIIELKSIFYSLMLNREIKLLNKVLIGICLCSNVNIKVRYRTF